MNPPSRPPVETRLVEDFLARCLRSAERAAVRLLPGREGVAPDYDARANDRGRSVLDGWAPAVEVLVGLHAAGACEFRLPLEALPPGGRLVPAGDDLEVLLPAQGADEGEPIAAAVLLGNDLLAESLLPGPAGLGEFCAEHLAVRRGWRDLRPRCGVRDVSFEIRPAGGAGEVWCTFRVEMDAT